MGDALVSNHEAKRGKGNTGTFNYLSLLIFRNVSSAASGIFLLI
jgi:hypothetical protein